MHHGTLSGASAGTGKGATFTLRFDSLPTPVEGPPDLQHSGTKQRRRPLRILFVEDHDDTCQVMSRMLRGFGYTVTCASSVKAALHQIETEEFDLLISDIGLPDGSGLDVMRYIKSRQNLKGIALSGFGMEEDVRRSRQAGFVQHLTKPVNFQKLGAVIEQIAP